MVTVDLTWREAGWYLARFAWHWLLGGKFWLSTTPGRVALEIKSMKVRMVYPFSIKSVNQGRKTMKIIAGALGGLFALLGGLTALCAIVAVPLYVLYLLYLMLIFDCAPPDFPWFPWELGDTMKTWWSCQGGE